MKRAPLIQMLAGSALALAMASSPMLAHASSSKPKQEVLYPNATRQEPKLDLTSDKDQKALNDGQEAAAAGDKDKAFKILQPIVDNSKSKYAQAFALQVMANLTYNEGDVKGAIGMLKRSLDNGVLPNDAYFQLMYELGQMYMADEQYQASIDTIEKWRAEGKKETAESYAIEGQDYYRLAKYPEAIAAIKKAQSLTDKPNPSWNQILLASYSESGQSDQAAQIAQQQVEANPNDPNALNNAVAALTQAQKYPQAIQLLEKARAAGTLKSETDYLNLAKLYRMQGQEADDPKADSSKAVAVIQEGMSKGVITSSYDNYLLLGDSALVAENNSVAAQAYAKAVPMAKDGEAALRAGQMLLTENKFAEAKSMIQQGIDKGVKHKGTAYMLLANAYIGMKDKPSAVEAMDKAAQDPETAAKAKAWLKQAGMGK